MEDEIWKTVRSYMDGPPLLGPRLYRLPRFLFTTGRMPVAFRSVSQLPHMADKVLVLDVAMGRIARLLRVDLLHLGISQERDMLVFYQKEEE